MAPKSPETDPRGGARPGAGRPANTGPFGEATRPVRLPESAIPTVLAYLDAHRQPATGVESRPVSLTPSTVALTAFASGVQAGFPSPADDYLQDVVDLNTHLIVRGHEPSTFIVRVKGWSMIGAGIHDGDEIVVDRALTARQGDIVVAIVNNDLTIKRLGWVDGDVALLPENAHFKPIVFKEGDVLEIWGVVTRCLRNLRR
jgi:DNA polymerase V